MDDINKQFNNNKMQVLVYVEQLDLEAINEALTREAHHNIQMYNVGDHLDVPVLISLSFEEYSELKLNYTSELV